MSCGFNSYNVSCCGSRRTIFDMMNDPCAQVRWHECKSNIYGKSPCGLTTAVMCDCRFPPKKCPPPPPPPKSCNSCHRVNPPRSCGFIVKKSNCCGEIGAYGSFSKDSAGSCCCCCCCSKPNKCPPVPASFNLSGSSSCFLGSDTLACRPIWKNVVLKASPWKLEPPPLPTRSNRYKSWVCQFGGKLDTNLCASRYSDRVDRSGCNMVIVEPPSGSCDPCHTCPCHPCAD